MGKKKNSGSGRGKTLPVIKSPPQAKTERTPPGFVQVEFQTGSMSEAAFEAQNAMQNGLGEALGLPGYGYFSPFGLPGNGYGFGGTEQISDTQTLFKNLRWYLVSNFRQLLSELYVEIGLVQTIVDLPVNDALRGGVTIQSSQLDEDEVKQLEVSMDRDNDLVTVGQAAKWNRLFGGAGNIILTDQDPEEPLDIKAITKDTQLDFRAVDMWELFWTAQNTEGYDPSIQSNDFEFYDYYGEKLHKSRVMRMTGLTAPSFIRPRLRGWGFSVVEVLVRSINQYLKGTDLGFEVLDEFKLDVYKIKNLVNTLLSPGGEAKIRARVQMANLQKNYQNAVVMDSEDDFDHKQLSFAGLAEAMAGIRTQVASDMRIPAVKLFGQSFSPGLGNASQEEMENYNAMVESEVRNKIKYDILRLIEIKCQKLFGFIPDDLSIEFKPLRVLTAEQEENVKDKKFQRALQARQAAEITTFEFREICNKDNLLGITLDNKGDSLNPLDPEIGDLTEEGSQDPDMPVDEDNPGEDRRDTNKAKLDPTKGKTKEGMGEYGGRKGESTSRPGTPTDKGDTKPGSRDPAAHNVLIMPKRYTTLERMSRVLGNSAQFDKASYEADGGDAWIPEGKRELFENPGKVDEALWSKAKEASQAALGKVKWQFVTWWYKKQGGKFN
jgi:phage-related protein (TIGR01555 family)